jgi:NTP pyrophosphatase (non-canonical NTP hydrolase)
MAQDGQIGKLAGMIRDFCQERDWDQFHSPKDLAIGLVTEAAELLEEFRFLTSDQCRARLEDAAGRKAVGEELADVLFFLLRFGERFGFDLAAELDAKMKINAEKYPAAEFRGRNHKYNRKPGGN